ncbi:MAG: hypothetical protein ABIO70_29355 [Pseudomonadota bacterium]
MKLAITTLFVFLVSTPAFAVRQSHDADDFDGTYAIECEAVAVNLHLGAVAWVGGSGGSWGTGVTEILSCDPILPYDEAWYGVYDPAYADCPAWLLGEEGCDEYASGVADGYMEVNNAAIGIIPYEVDLDVITTHPVNRWLGIYPGSSYNYAPLGDWAGSLIMDNRNGYAGNYISGAIGLAVPWTGVGCINAGAALALGTVDPYDDYAVDGEFGAIDELICGAGDADAGFLVTVGLAVANTVVGEKSE